MEDECLDQSFNQTDDSGSEFDPKITHDYNIYHDYEHSRQDTFSSNLDQERRKLRRMTMTQEESFIATRIQSSGQINGRSAYTTSLFESLSKTLVMLQENYEADDMGAILETNCTICADNLWRLILSPPSSATSDTLTISPYRYSLPALFFFFEQPTITIHLAASTFSSLLLVESPEYLRSWAKLGFLVAMVPSRSLHSCQKTSSGSSDCSIVLLPV